MASQPKVFALLRAPDRKSCQIGIGKAVRRIQAKYDLTRDALAKLINDTAGEKICTGDTISNAANEKHLIEFDVIAMLGYLFDDEDFEPIAELWLRNPPEPKTRKDKFRDAHALLDELEKGE